MLQSIAKDNYDEARELRGLFEKQLMEIYWSENIMLKTCTDVADETQSTDLTTLLRIFKAKNTDHSKSIEGVFHRIGLVAEELEYEGIQCLLTEVNTICSTIRRGVVRDAALIATLQKIRHHHIACYGTMRAYAIALREEDIVVTLENLLDDEKQADLALTKIAESHINIEAADKEI